MSLKEIIRASAFYRRYCRMEQGLTGLYCSSRLYGLTAGLYSRIKACFKYSFLGRATEIRQSAPAFLGSSQTLRCLADFYNYAKRGAVFSLAEEIKVSLRSSPLRAFGIITAGAVIVNTCLFIAFHRQISPWGWVARGLFLFAAMAGVFSKAGWPAVKAGSIFLKRALR